MKTCTDLVLDPILSVIFVSVELYNVTDETIYIVVKYFESYF